MRLRVLLCVVLAGLLASPQAWAEAKTLQQIYLEIYLKINDAEHLEKQGDFRAALDDFKDCYQRLDKIHRSEPNWETALVVHRMEDCKAKIQELEPKAMTQGPSNPPPAPTGNAPGLPPLTPTSNPDQVASLKLQLDAVRTELQVTKQKLADSQSQLETYRVQLQSVNQQLKDARATQSNDDKMGQLLTQNKQLTEKLATAQKEIDGFKINPKSKLAMAQAQLKNLQDQFEASQEANKALQATTSTLKQQLDQASADLIAANQKLATATAGSPEYLTLKRENEVMRGILTRELQEQAHRDMAKRLFQEEYDNLKLKSKVLQEQVDILASPMTPATNDEERQMLASLHPSGPDVAAPTAGGNSFAAPGGIAAPTSESNAPSAVAPTPPSAETNVATSTPPATDATTNAPTSAMSDPATTNTVSTPANNVSITSPVSATSTNADVAVTPAPPDTNAPLPPATVPGQTPAAAPSTNSNSVAMPSKTVTDLPPTKTVVEDKTIINNPTTPANGPGDPSTYSVKARLPDDMRETAQQAADLFKNQKFDESAAKYQSIIDKYPESLYAWSNLGVVRFQQGKFDEALKALQQAVKLSPTDAFSYSNLGIVYYQLNQFENAIDALNTAKALDPNDPKTHNYLGCACSQKGWQEVAEKEFRKAIEIDSNFGDAHFNLALVYATSKPPSLELARREYNRALELGIAKDARLEKLLQGTGAQAQASP